MYYLCSENKGIISFAVTAKLICAFVFAYAKSWFSYEVAHIEYNSVLVLIFESYKKIMNSLGHV